jgi:hypothetical protein
MTGDDMIDRGEAMAVAANMQERAKTRRELEQATAEAVLVVMRRLGMGLSDSAEENRAHDRLLYGLRHYQEVRGIEWDE